MIAKGENYELLGATPETISVVNGVVGGGSEVEKDILAYADGKIVVNSPVNGMLYIVKKGAGLIAAQLAYAITADTEVKYDFAADETAYLWDTALAPICNPFTISQ